jgi:hypothetical protein
MAAEGGHAIRAHTGSRLYASPPQSSPARTRQAHPNSFPLKRLQVPSTHLGLLFHQLILSLFMPFQRHLPAICFPPSNLLSGTGTGFWVIGPCSQAECMSVWLHPSQSQSSHPSHRDWLKGWLWHPNPANQSPPTEFLPVGPLFHLGSSLTRMM